MSSGRVNNWFNRSAHRCSLLGVALPLLLVAVCPISMLLMMRGMQGSQRASQPAEASQPTRAALTRDAQLAELKAQLSTIQVQHETIAREIAELERADNPAVREAEVVAGVAHDRVRA